MLSYSELWSIQEPLLAMAAIIESYIHFSGRIKTWRNVNAEWWFRIQMLEWPKLHIISEKFLHLYEAIFGSKIFSFRRIFASFLSSSLFSFCLFFCFRAIQGTFLPNHGYNLDRFYASQVDWFSSFFFKENEITNVYSLKGIFWILHQSVGLNFVPDFISLAETGLIIRLASKQGAKIGRLFALDFFFTTAILIASHAIAWLIIFKTSTYQIPFNLNHILDQYSLFSGSAPTWISYAITTYSTSVIWWLFVLFTVTVKVLKSSVPLTVKLLESKYVADLPILLFIGIPCLLSWPMLFFLRLIAEQ